MAHIAPKSEDAEMSPNEVWRANRAQMALELHVTPEQIDKMSLRDYADLREVIRARGEIRRYEERQRALEARRMTRR
jgi:hypothetical protein